MQDDDNTNRQYEVGDQVIGNYSDEYSVDMIVAETEVIVPVMHRPDGFFI